MIDCGLDAKIANEAFFQDYLCFMPLFYVTLAFNRRSLFTNFMVNVNIYWPFLFDDLKKFALFLIKTKNRFFKIRFPFTDENLLKF